MGWIHLSGPDEPAVNAHNEVIAIYHHISQQSPFEQEVDEDRSADHSSGKYEYPVLFGIPNRHKAKNNSCYFQYNVDLVVFAVLIENILNKLAHVLSCLR